MCSAIRSGCSSCAGCTPEIEAFYECVSSKRGCPPFHCAGVQTLVADSPPVSPTESTPEPPTDPSTSAPTGTNASPTSPLWTILQGNDCVIDGICIQNADFDSNSYDDNEFCRFAVLGALPYTTITVEYFCTEQDYDIITYNGIEYSGCQDDSAGGLEGLIVGEAYFEWNSDTIITRSNGGWRLCLDTLPSCGMTEFNNYRKASHGASSQAACIVM